MADNPFKSDSLKRLWNQNSGNAAQFFNGLEQLLKGQSEKATTNPSGIAPYSQKTYLQRYQDTQKEIGEYITKLSAQDLETVFQDPAALTAYSKLQSTFVRQITEASNSGAQAGVAVGAVAVPATSGGAGGTPIPAVSTVSQDASGGGGGAPSAPGQSPLSTEDQTRRTEAANEELQNRIDSPSCKIFRLFEILSDEWSGNIQTAPILVSAQPGQDETESATMIDKKQMQLFYLKNAFYSGLTPTVKLYKVKRSEPQTISGVTEIVFPLHAGFSAVDPTTPSIEQIIDSNVGIKSFSYKFSGTDRFTSERDIEAKLVIFAESLDSIFQDRGGYKFSDLMMQADCFTEAETAGDTRPYRPECYEIIADVGWDMGYSSNTTTFADIKTLTGGSPNYHPEVLDMGVLEETQTLRKSFRTTMDLTVVDHEINLQQNGSVEISIEYRARLETALRTARGSIIVADDAPVEDGDAKNAAAEAGCTNSTVGELIKCLEDKIQETQSSNAETQNPDNQETIQKCNTALDKIREEYANKFLVALTEKLTSNNKIYSVRLEGVAAYDAYLQDSTYENLRTLVQNAQGAVGQLTTTDDEEEAFVYFGDLVDAVLDMKDAPTKLTEFRIVLGTVKLPSISQSSQYKNYAIGSLPVPLKSIQSYITDKVAKGKRNLSLFGFLKELTNFVLVNSMCFEGLPKYRVFYQQATSFGEVPTGTTYNEILESINPVFNASKPIERIYHVLLIGFESPTYTEVSSGTVGGDIEKKIPHYLFGAVGGPFLSVSLQKTDQPYLKEARFEKAGDRNILTQLSNVYDANISMIGNNMLVPGSLVFLNLGAVARELGNPGNPDSTAYILGLGGLHLVTEVSSELTPSSFKTNLKARFVSRGTFRSGGQSD